MVTRSLTRLLLGLLCTALLLACEAAESVALLDLDGRSVEPFTASAPPPPARVFLFVGTTCPISNRYAPEVRRLYEQFAGQGVEFRLVYPDPDDTADAIRKHVADFSYPMRALRDPQQSLVRITGASVTPEVAVFTDGDRLVYRGRIDDWYLEFGKERAAPTTRDLRDVLAAIVAGEQVAPRTTQAIGCEIPDPA